MDNTHDDLYLVSWDCNGLEYLVNLTDEEKSSVFKVLKGEKQSFNSWLQHTVSMMTMRARYNSQRHYEIYSFWVDRDIDEESLREMFDQDPQGTVDLIRVKGNKIYSDRVEPDKIRIV